MINKHELRKDLITICDEILLQIIAPACGITIDTSDFWLSDISVYTNDDEELNQKIYEAIQLQYNLTTDDMNYIDSFTTIMQIALFIYWNTPTENLTT